MQLEIPIDTVEYAATIACKYGKKVILNPAPASSLSNSFLMNVHTILPNRIEAEMLSGIKVMNIESAHRAAQAIGEKGIENVVITLGKDGAYVKEKDEYTMIPAKEVGRLTQQVPEMYFAEHSASACLKGIHSLNL